MLRKRLLWAGALIALPLLAMAVRSAAQSTDKVVVRLAELEIDPAQVEAYKSALREEISASIRVEPGVLTLCAVAVKDHPGQIRLFEMYASPAAYASHLESAHFKKYKNASQGMVRSLRLLETETVALGSKPR